MASLCNPVTSSAVQLKLAKISSNQEGKPGFLDFLKTCISAHRHTT